MSVTTSANLPAGSYHLTITGASGSLVHTTAVTLVVSAGGGGDFSIGVSPNSQTVARGASTTYSVTVTPSGGFTGTVNLSVTGLPIWTSASFVPVAVTGSGSSTLTVATSPNRKTPIGTYTLTIIGASGSLSHSATMTLVVQ